MTIANESTLKIRIISDHTEYQKDQIYDLKEKVAIPLLTNGKAIRIHRETSEQTSNEVAEEVNERAIDKPKLKTKKE